MKEEDDSGSSSGISNGISGATQVMSASVSPHLKKEKIDSIQYMWELNQFLKKPQSDVNATESQILFRSIMPNLVGSASAMLH